MNINRHNYEEFFILYMDNELGSDERRMVETFVQQHPDLKEELDLLLQFKLEPDTEIHFSGKEDLMKINGNTPITLTNYEEWLVLYIDNELTTGQRQEVEQFIAANPSLKNDFNSLKRSKLQPEQIVFADKASLYRKEERDRRIPPVWWRAVAAILILAIGLTTVVVINNRKAAVKPDVAVVVPGTEKKTIPEKTNTTTSIQNTVTPKETAINNDVKKEIIPTINQDNKNIAVKNNKPLNNNVVKNNSIINIPVPEKKDDQVVANNDNNKPTNNLPVPINNSNANRSNATGSNDAIVSTPVNQDSKINTPVTKNEVEPSQKDNPDVQNASLTESGNNKKSRGLFRKIARTFEKRTNMSAADDDRLLVGGLAFKLK